jgi:23S rRNA pseudouridine2457 synthase
MVSQFVSSHKVRLLGDLDFDFPEGIHAIGRLDANSEGLLLLTTNKKVTRLLFQGDQPHSRKYLVQVKNIVTDATIEKLRNGVNISGAKASIYTTLPCEINRVEELPALFSSGLSIRNGVPNTWLEISLMEGKFHQVRKMVAAVHHKCIRLIRISIEDIDVKGIAPGQVLEIDEELFFKRLKINYKG